MAFVSIDHDAVVLAIVCSNAGLLERYRSWAPRTPHDSPLFDARSDSVATGLSDDSPRSGRPMFSPLPGCEGDAAPGAANTPDFRRAGTTAFVPVAYGGGAAAAATPSPTSPTECAQPPGCQALPRPSELLMLAAHGWRGAGKQGGVELLADDLSEAASPVARANAAASATRELVVFYATPLDALSAVLSRLWRVRPWQAAALSTESSLLVWRPVGTTATPSAITGDFEGMVRAASALPFLGAVEGRQGSASTMSWQGSSGVGGLLQSPSNNSSGSGPILPPDALACVAADVAEALRACGLIPAESSQLAGHGAALASHIRCHTGDASVLDSDSPPDTAAQRWTLHAAVARGDASVMRVRGVPSKIAAACGGVAVGGGAPAAALSCAMARAAQTCPRVAVSVSVVSSGQREAGTSTNGGLVVDIGNKGSPPREPADTTNDPDSLASAAAAAMGASHSPRPLYPTSPTLGDALGASMTLGVGATPATPAPAVAAPAAAAATAATTTTPSLMSSVNMDAFASLGSDAQPAVVVAVAFLPLDEAGGVPPMNAARSATSASGDAEELRAALDGVSALRRVALTAFGGSLVAVHRGRPRSPADTNGAGRKEPSSGHNNSSCGSSRAVVAVVAFADASGGAGDVGSGCVTTDGDAFASAALSAAAGGVFSGGGFASGGMLSGSGYGSGGGFGGGGGGAGAAASAALRAARCAFYARAAIGRVGDGALAPPRRDGARCAAVAVTRGSVLRRAVGAGTGTAPVAGGDACARAVALARAAVDFTASAAPSSPTHGEPAPVVVCDDATFFALYDGDDGDGDDVAGICAMAREAPESLAAAAAAALGSSNSAFERNDDNSNNHADEATIETCWLLCGGPTTTAAATAVCGEPRQLQEDTQQQHHYQTRQRATSRLPLHCISGSSSRGNQAAARGHTGVLGTRTVRRLMAMATADGHEFIGAAQTILRCEASLHAVLRPTVGTPAFAAALAAANNNSNNNKQRAHGTKGAAEGAVLAGPAPFSALVISGGFATGKTLLLTRVAKKFALFPTVFVDCGGLAAPTAAALAADVAARLTALLRARNVAPSVVDAAEVTVAAATTDAAAAAAAGDTTAETAAAWRAFDAASAAAFSPPPPALPIGARCVVLLDSADALAASAPSPGFAVQAFGAVAAATAASAVRPRATSVVSPRALLSTLALAPLCDVVSDYATASSTASMAAAGSFDLMPPTPHVGDDTAVLNLPASPPSALSVFPLRRPGGPAPASSGPNSGPASLQPSPGGGFAGMFPAVGSFAICCGGATPADFATPPLSFSSAPPFGLGSFGVGRSSPVVLPVAEASASSPSGVLPPLLPFSALHEFLWGLATRAHCDASCPKRSIGGGGAGANAAPALFSTLPPTAVLCAASSPLPEASVPVCARCHAGSVGVCVPTTGGNSAAASGSGSFASADPTIATPVAIVRTAVLPAATSEVADARDFLSAVIGRERFARAARAAAAGADVATALSTPTTLAAAAGGGGAASSRGATFPMTPLYSSATTPTATSADATEVAAAATSEFDAFAADALAAARGSVFVLRAIARDLCALASGSAVGGGGSGLAAAAFLSGPPTTPRACVATSSPAAPVAGALCQPPPGSHRRAALSDIADSSAITRRHAARIVASLGSAERRALCAAVCWAASRDPCGLRPLNGSDAQTQNEAGANYNNNNNNNNNSGWVDVGVDAIRRLERCGVPDIIALAAVSPALRGCLDIVSAGNAGHHGVATAEQISNASLSASHSTSSELVLSAATVVPSAIGATLRNSPPPSPPMGPAPAAGAAPRSASVRSLTASVAGIRLQPALRPAALLAVCGSRAEIRAFVAAALLPGAAWPETAEWLALPLPTRLWCAAGAGMLTPRDSWSVSFAPPAVITTTTTTTTTTASVGTVEPGWLQSLRGDVVAALISANNGSAALTAAWEAAEVLRRWGVTPEALAVFVGAASPTPLPRTANVGSVGFPSATPPLRTASASPAADAAVAFFVAHVAAFAPRRAPGTSTGLRSALRGGGSGSPMPQTPLSLSTLGGASAFASAAVGFSPSSVGGGGNATGTATPIAGSRFLESSTSASGGGGGVSLATGVAEIDAAMRELNAALSEASRCPDVASVAVAARGVSAAWRALRGVVDAAAKAVGEAYFDGRFSAEVAAAAAAVDAWVDAVTAAAAGTGIGFCGTPPSAGARFVDPQSPTLLGVAVEGGDTSPTAGVATRLSAAPAVGAAMGTPMSPLTAGAPQRPFVAALGDARRAVRGLQSSVAAITREAFGRRVSAADCTELVATGLKLLAPCEAMARAHHGLVRTLAMLLPEAAMPAHVHATDRRGGRDKTQPGVTSAAIAAAEAARAAHALLAACHGVHCGVLFEASLMAATGYAKARRRVHEASHAALVVTLLRLDAQHRQRRSHGLAGDLTRLLLHALQVHVAVEDAALVRHVRDVVGDCGVQCGNLLDVATMSPQDPVEQSEPGTGGASTRFFSVWLPRVEPRALEEAQPVKPLLTTGAKGWRPKPRGTAAASAPTSGSVTASNDVRASPALSSPQGSEAATSSLRVEP